MARHERVSEAIRREISVILHEELKDPRLGFITITKVELSQDMRYAMVFYSVLGREEDIKKTRQALESGMGFIRKHVAEKINLRFAPEISFREDHASEYSVRIQQVLDEIKEINEPVKRSRTRKKA